MSTTFAGNQSIKRGSKRSLRPSHINEYLGVWAIRPEYFQTISSSVMPKLSEYVARFGTLEAGSTLAASGGNSQYDLTPDGTAIIEIRGTMMKFASSFGGGGTVAARRKLRAAMHDPFVKGIVLVIDSPGGTVSGTQDLASDVAAATKKKPVYVQIEDLCCSAAYWVGSQATKIFAGNETALGPCIGTYMVVDDASKAFEAKGIKTHLIKAGEFKGAGVWGTEVTAEQIREWQVEVDDLNEQFVRGVASGRRANLATAKKWADGRLFVAKKMLDFGMIDGIQSLEVTIDMAAKGRTRSTSSSAAGGSTSDDGAAIAAEGAEPLAEDTQQDNPEAADSAADPTQNSPAPNGGAEATEVPESAAADANLVTEESQMSTATEPKAATLKELKAAFPKADHAFLIGQLESESTLAQAKDAWLAEVEDRQAKAEARAEEAETKRKEAEEKATAAATAVPKPGNANPLGGAAPASAPAAGSEDTDDEVETDSGPIGQFRAAVREEVKAGRSKVDATRRVMKAQPLLYESYLKAYNEKFGESAKAAKRIYE